MVVSRDWQEVSVLECILGSLHIGVHIETNAEHASTKILKARIDALIVDRDLSGTDRFLENFRSLRNDVNSVPLVLLSGSPDRHNLFASGATFYFEKPVSVEQAVRTFSATRNLMLNGRLRYHRQQVKAPVSLRFAGHKKPLNVDLLNLSQGGIGIRAPQALDARGPVEVRFDLPEADCVVQARGELRWTDAKGNAGIRLLEVPEVLERRMQRWLEKRYFDH